MLAANLETAINGLWDARPHVGDRVVVIGAGTVGCLVAWLAGRIAGCDVELVDINPRRATIAKALGVRFASPETVFRRRGSRHPRERLARGPRDVLKIAGFEATIVEMSWYGDQAVSLKLGEAFHARRLTLKSSQVGTIPASQRPRWDTARRMGLALSLLQDASLDALITGESGFEELPATMATLAAAPGDTLCHRIRYS